MSRIANTEVIVPKSLSAEARHQLIDALYAVHHLEVQHPLRVVAQENARIVLLPRGAATAREASLAKAA